MKSLGYGRDYRTPHEAPDHFVDAANLPEALGDERFYEPQEAGEEAAIAVRLARWRARRDAGERS